MSESEESAHVCSCGGNCGCQDEAMDSQQIYLTREEYVGRLEDYLARLKEEIVSVEQELVDLRQTA